MKKLAISLALIPFLITGTASAKSYTVTNSGYTFSPGSLTINMGDEVVFSLGSMHNAVEVSKTTYDANGNTSNGGFSVPYGGGKVTFTKAGTYYYVCQPHAQFGMKGIIVVTETSTAILNTDIKPDFDLTVFPNPARDHINLNISVPDNNLINIDLLDITGNRVAILLSADYPKGNYSMIFSLNNLVSGKYILRCKTGDKVYIKPVVIYSSL